MTPRLSGHFSIFGKVLFSLCSSLFWELRDNGVFKICNFDPKASESCQNFKRSNVGYQWAKLLCTNSQTLYTYSGFLFYNQPIKIIDLEVTKNTVKPVKPSKYSTRPYLNEIPAHFIYRIKTKGYDAIGVNVFPHKLMRFPRKKKE